MLLDYYKGIFSLLDQEKLILGDKESDQHFLIERHAFNEINGDDEDEG